MTKVIHPFKIVVAKIEPTPELLLNNTKIVLQGALRLLNRGIRVKTNRYKNGKLGIKDFAIDCNGLLNDFIKELHIMLPTKQIQKVYPEHFPLENTQAFYQEKMDTINDPKQRITMTQVEYDTEVLTIIYEFQQIISSANFDAIQSVMEESEENIEAA